MLEKLGEVGLDKSKFGLHSLHSGGASAAANAGIPDRWFKRLDRWRSESAILRIVWRTFVENALNVFHKMCLLGFTYFVEQFVFDFDFCALAGSSRQLRGHY